MHLQLTEVDGAAYDYPATIFIYAGQPAELHLQSIVEDNLVLKVSSDDETDTPVYNYLKEYADAIVLVNDACTLKQDYRLRIESVPVEVVEQKELAKDAFERLAPTCDVQCLEVPVETLGTNGNLVPLFVIDDLSTALTESMTASQSTIGMSIKGDDHNKKNGESSSIYYTVGSSSGDDTSVADSFVANKARFNMESPSRVPVTRPHMLDQLTPARDAVLSARDKYRYPIKNPEKPKYNYDMALKRARYQQGLAMAVQRRAIVAKLNDRQPPTGIRAAWCAFRDRIVSLSSPKQTLAREQFRLMKLHHRLVNEPYLMNRLYNQY